MDLRQIVESYKKLAGGFGKPVALSAFALPRPETERIFSALDEDYHISRHFQFSNQTAAEAFSINGFPQTHMAIDAAILEDL